MSKPSSSPLLEMRRVSKQFGPTVALRDVSFALESGTVMALIGENGAGKSTLMKILSGALSPGAGEMRLAGRPYAPAGPHDARTAGVAMIYQELNLAPDLTVEDNIMLGVEERIAGWLRRGVQRQRVREALEMLGHRELRPQTPVYRLSIGAQQLVEIARALVLRSRLIVFDEPTSSLAGRDVERLFGVIRKLRDSGIGVVYISHFLEEIRQVCDRYTVLRDGQTAGTGEVAGAPEEEIVSQMVGRTVQELFPTIPHAPGEAILSLRELTGQSRPTNVSLELRRGEILGIAGLVGAGRTELLRAIFGLDPVRRGEVKVRGASLPASPRARIRAGVGLVSEDRKREGLAQSRSLADNLTYSRMAPYSRLGWLNLSQRRAAVREWMERMHVKARSPEQSAESLSGGNQQKIALARVLHQDADVLLLDEPTRGIDVGTKAEIYRLIGELAAAGKAIIFVSSYLPELLAVCDRVGVMSRGRLRDIRPAGEWTEEAIMARAVAVETGAET
ncbi:MAG: sugar ABC transporter ATP-binding protein [Planctomycetes bacterium]|nr:sugar ABC transporter ATP-binding protein [Planctomycetota bacterium]